MKPCRRIIGCLMVVALVTMSAFRLEAHDSPEHAIEELTARIQAVGERPDLLWRRAVEHRALGQWKEARSDLRRALKVRPDYVQALVDLSRVELAEGRTRRSLSAIRRAMDLRPEPGTRAGLEMVHAEILARRAKWADAIAACDRALAGAEVPDPEWYLTRSQYQYQLGRHAEAAAGLKEGFERIGNVVLEAEWIEALIDAGDCRAALKRLEPWMEGSRYQSSWRVRRARASMGLGDSARAQADLFAALEELGPRLRGPQPDVTLLAERGLAYALLGDLQLAQADLARATKAGADPWVLFRLKRILAEHG